MNALISIDYTYDFVAEDGKLTTGAAGQAIEKADCPHKKFMEQKDFVILPLMHMIQKILSIQRTAYFLRIM